MSDSAVQSVLKRKATAHLPAEDFATTPHGALLDSFVRTADKTISLHAVAVTGENKTVSMAELLDMMPEKGQLAVLEGPKETPGVMIVDSAMLSGLVEFQTIGEVNGVLPPERKATRTDAALMAGFIDMLLKLFAETLEETDHAPWVTGYRYTGTLPDARPFALLLEDEDYRLVDITVQIGDVARESNIKLALVAKGRAQITPKTKKKSKIGETQISTGTEDPQKWSEAFGSVIQESDVMLSAVLHRMFLPISQVNAFEVGDVLAVPMSALRSIRIEGQNRALVAEGRLGQSQNSKAVRIDHVGDTQEEGSVKDGRSFISSEKGMERVRPSDPAGLLDLHTGVPELMMPETGDVPMPQMDDFPDISDGSDLPPLDDEASEMPAFELPADLPDLDAVEIPAMDEPLADGVPLDLPDLSDGAADFPELGDLPKID